MCRGSKRRFVSYVDVLLLIRNGVLRLNDGYLKNKCEFMNKYEFMHNADFEAGVFP